MVKIDKKYAFTGTQGQTEACSIYSKAAASSSSITSCSPHQSPVGPMPAALDAPCNRPVRPSGASPRPRYVLLPRLPRAAQEHRKVQKTDGMDLPWYSSEGTDFNADFGPHHRQRRELRLSAFIHDDEDNIYHTYFTVRPRRRGAQCLDLPRPQHPSARQEEWEDSPSGVPQTKPFVWWRRHDEYGKDAGGQHP